MPSVPTRVVAIWIKEIPMNRLLRTRLVVPAIGLVLTILLALTACRAQDPSTVPSYADAVKKMEAQMSASKDAPKVSEQDAAVMAKAAADLAAQMPNPGLKVGAKAPDFSLKNPNGKTVQLSAALKNGPVVLTFYRGAWCPYCSLQMHQLNEALPQFKKQGASLIAITPQTPDKTVDQFKQEGYPFEVLSDLDYKVIKSYNLLWNLPPELDAVYKRAFGLDVQAYNGPGRLGLPIPGTFVIDRGGIVRAAFANTDYKKRMEPADILAALQQLSGKKQLN